MDKRYIPAAIRELRELEGRKTAARNLRERICVLEADATSTRGVTASPVPIRGGGNRNEERLIRYLQQKDQLERRLSALEQTIAVTQRTLDSMAQPRRRALELFYIDRPCGYMWKLMDELGYSRSAVYRLKDDALEEFCLKMYG